MTQTSQHKSNIIAYLGFLLLLAFTFSSSHAEQAKEPYVFKSAHGHRVKVVAIWDISSDGIKISPMPTAPLIGSNKLQTITTAWENIDVESLKPYTDVYAAAKKAISGESVEWKACGVHLIDLKGIKSRIHELKPRINTYDRDDKLKGYTFEQVVQEKIRRTIKRWYIDKVHKEEALKGWGEIARELEPISYRSDVIRLADDLKIAIRSMERIPTVSEQFNLSYAQNIADLTR